MKVQDPDLSGAAFFAVCRGKVRLVACCQHVAVHGDIYFIRCLKGSTLLTEMAGHAS